MQPMQPQQQYQNMQPNQPMQPQQQYQNMQPNQPVQPQQQYQNMQPNQPMQSQQQYQNIQQNQPIPQNQQMPLNQRQNQQLPPLPKISNQQSHPAVALYSSQHIPIRKTSSVQSMQSSGSNMQLQSSASRLSLGGMSSAQSMQSMESSDAMISQQSSQSLLPTQTFPVIYNQVSYMVDPSLLMNSSLKFRELIQPFLKDDQIRSDIKLEVVGYDFTNRNMNNFLRLCQNLPTDVQNSEMKEVCEIAKMFQAEKIYDTGANFVMNNIDPNFSVPDSKYDGSDGKTWMFIECDANSIHHADIQNLDFNDIEDEDEENDENDEKEDNKVNNSSDDKKNNKKDKNGKKIKSVIYYVRIENHSLKCPIYRFCLDNKILYTAKQKGNQLYVASGNDIHISDDPDNHAARIYQDSAKNNFIFIDRNQYKLSYVESGRPNQLSVSITFPYKDRQIVWTPKTPKYNAIKDKYYLNFHGEYHHHALHSRRNMVLQNNDGHTTFICRKTSENVFELEALPVIDPLIIFSIGLSNIVGPYNDPLKAF